MAVPVLALELLRGSRRGRQHLFRLVYGGWLLVEFVIFALLFFVRTFEDDFTGQSGWTGNPSALGALTGSFLGLLAVQQALLLVLALPAFAAGAITEEKTRGTLQDLLTTALTPGEVVVGKLLAQVVRVVDLSLPGWLLLGFVSALDGLRPVQLLVLVAALLAPLPALGAAGLLASVWCRRTTNAVLTVYGVTVGAVALLWLAGVASPTALPSPAEVGMAWLACAGLTVPLLALASWRLRPAYVRQLTAGPRRPLGPWAADRPPVGDHPVRWKEQYVERVLDLPGLRRVPRRAGVAAVFVLTMVSSSAIVLTNLPVANPLALVGKGDFAALLHALATSGPSWRGFAAQGLVVMFLAGLAAGARACGAVSGERERQTWDPLLLTPLTTKQLVRSKVWGCINVFRPYLVAYTIPAVALAVLGGVAAVVWTVACWALTWVMMYFMAASGIGCSVRSASSWRSWVATLLAGYRDLLANFVLRGLPIGMLVGAALWMLIATIVFGLSGTPGTVARVMNLTGTYFPLVPGLLTAVFVFARAEQLLMEAEKHLDRTDRVHQRPTPRTVPAAVRAPA